MVVQCYKSGCTFKCQIDILYYVKNRQYVLTSYLDTTVKLYVYRIHILVELMWQQVSCDSLCYRKTYMLCICYSESSKGTLAISYCNIHNNYNLFDNALNTKDYCSYHSERSPYKMSNCEINHFSKRKCTCTLYYVWKTQ